MKLSVQKKKILILFAFFYLLLSFFWQFPSVNSVPRLATAIRLVEEHALDLNEYESFTIDKALISGKYYNDKAPLSTLLYLPIHAIDKLIHRHGPADPVSKGIRANRLALQWINYPVFAAFCVFLFLSLNATGASASQSMMLTLAASFGTYLFPMASNYFGHHIAAGFLFVSYLFFQKRDRKSLLLAGLLLGFAFATEYTSYLFGFVAALALFVEKRFKSVPDIFILGSAALPGIAIVLLNNMILTGSPLHFSYEFEATKEFQAMQSNLGFRVPSASAMWELTFGQYRGMIFYAPFLLAALPALFLRLREEPRRIGFALGFSGVWIFFISMFYLWSGGAAYGPRYLIAISFILFYEAAHAVVKFKIIRMTAYLGLVGLIFASATQCVNALAPEQYGSPVFDFVFPAIFAGSGALWGENAGNLLGLSPILTMILWMILCIGGARGVIFLIQKVEQGRPHAI